MKVVILAGGKGTRISEYTKLVPKPMIKIAGLPIIIHIIKLYIKYGFKDFIIAAGYKSVIVENYFQKNKFNCNIQVINTGLNTMTGGRIKRLFKHLKKETFLMTYGDGISDVNLNKLIAFHKKKKKLITMTAVRPPARFGVIKFKGEHVKYFKEKPTMDEGWINGGYFVIEPDFIKFIKNDRTYLEKEPLETALKKKQLIAYKHYGFWQCIDTKRDKVKLEKVLKLSKI